MRGTMPSRGLLRRPVGDAAALRCEGDYWTIAYDAVAVRIRDAKGLRYLEWLLRHPGRSFHVAELLRVTGCPDPRRLATEDAVTEAVERARKAVTNRIRETLLRIAGLHQALGLHLRNAVHTGTHCTYSPERPTRWSASTRPVASLGLVAHQRAFRQRERHSPPSESEEGSAI